MMLPIDVNFVRVWNVYFADPLPHPHTQTHAQTSIPKNTMRHRTFGFGAEQTFKMFISGHQFLFSLSLVINLSWTIIKFIS